MPTVSPQKSTGTPAPRPAPVALGAPRMVPIAALDLDRSPRHGPVDEAHVEALREVLHHLPPVLVHAGTMAVIDGVHRVVAHRRSGHLTIAAHLFGGSTADALVIAVRANVTHGLPLTIADRRRAAGTILGAHPDRSDRWVAAMCGLSHTTVARIRQATAARAGVERRLGADGRRRPVDAGLVRDRIRALIAETPTASVRQIAAAAGASLSTVHAVRVELRDAATAPPLDAPHPEAAEQLTRLLDGPEPPLRWAAVVRSLPPACLGAVLTTSRRRATEWASVTAAVEQRLEATGERVTANDEETMRCS